MSAGTATIRPAVTTPWLPAAVALTLFDAAATWLWLELGVAVEANPLLRGLVEQSGAAAAMASRALVGVVLLTALGWLAPRSRLARRALPALTAVLLGVAVWHVLGFLAFGSA